MNTVGFALQILLYSEVTNRPKSNRFFHEFCVFFCSRRRRRRRNTAGSALFLSFFFFSVCLILGPAGVLGLVFAGPDQAFPAGHRRAHRRRAGGVPGREGQVLPGGLERGALQEQGGSLSHPNLDPNYINGPCLSSAGRVIHGHGPRVLLFDQAGLCEGKGGVELFKYCTVGVFLLGRNFLTPLTICTAMESCSWQIPVSNVGRFGT